MGGGRGTGRVQAVYPAISTERVGRERQEGHSNFNSNVKTPRPPKIIGPYFRGSPVPLSQLKFELSLFRSAIVRCRGL
jgi:hypothetical protein